MSKTVKTTFLFGLLEKFVITDIAETEPYLIRWQFRAPFDLFTVKLHKICRPDGDRCPHDHPWGFVRVILTGGYGEVYGPESKPQILLPGSVTYCPPNFRHRITNLLAGPSWSLVLTGPRVQEWGFYTKAGWVQWERFIKALRSEKVLWCDDGTQAVLGETLEKKQLDEMIDYIDSKVKPAPGVTPEELREFHSNNPTLREYLQALQGHEASLSDPDWWNDRYCPRFDCPECGVRHRGVRYTTGCKCSQCGALIAPWTIKGNWPLPPDEKDVVV